MTNAPRECCLINYWQKDVSSLSFGVVIAEQAFGLVATVPFFNLWDDDKTTDGQPVYECAARLTRHVNDQRNRTEEAAWHAATDRVLLRLHDFAQQLVRGHIGTIEAAAAALLAKTRLDGAQLKAVIVARRRSEAIYEADMAALPPTQWSASYD